MRLPKAAGDAGVEEVAYGMPLAAPPTSLVGPEAAASPERRAFMRRPLRAPRHKRLCGKHTARMSGNTTAWIDLKTRVDEIGSTFSTGRPLNTTLDPTC